jgi:nucleoside-diphosphate-sugar epimerase
MEIIGTGFLGRGFAPLADTHPGVVVLAAGVSTTSPVPEPEYVRDAALVADVVQRCKRQGKLLVYPSTASTHIYGAPGCAGREEQPVYPTSAYGRHKLLLETVVRQSGARHLILRLGHTVGPGQPSHQLLPVLTRSVLAGKVGVFRGASRDLIALEDVVTILDRLLRAGIESDVVNIASGVPVPVDDIVDHLEKRLGAVAERVYTGTHPENVVSTDKLRRHLPQTARMAFGPTYYQKVIDALIEPMTLA